MSAEKPEVGDIFLDYKKERFVVIKVDEVDEVDKGDKDDISLLYLIKGIPQCLNTCTGQVLKHYDYLGKSKANVENLFELSDD